MKCPECQKVVVKGNYCSNCGNKLTKPTSLKKRVEELEEAIRYYLECYYKKMAGSTIQFTPEEILGKMIDWDE